MSENLRFVLATANLVSRLQSLLKAAMAEWLRRLTRNQMGSSRVGSNPTRSGDFFEFFKDKNVIILRQIFMHLFGLKIK